MKKQELEIEILNDGTVSINVQGVKGSTCLDLTKDLEESLGLVNEREKKSSFYEQDDQKNMYIQGEKNASTQH
jgi:hypothetical protein